MNKISLEKGGPYMGLNWRLVKKNLKTLTVCMIVKIVFPLCKSLDDSAPTGFNCANWFLY